MILQAMKLRPLAGWCWAVSISWADTWAALSSPLTQFLHWTEANLRHWWESDFSWPRGSESLRSVKVLLPSVKGLPSRLFLRSFSFSLIFLLRLASSACLSSSNSPRYSSSFVILFSSSLFLLSLASLRLASASCTSLTCFGTSLLALTFAS